MLQIDFYIVLAQLVNFWILYLVFRFFIAEKLYQKIDERKKQLEKLRQAEEHYEEKLRLAEETKQKMLQETRKTTAELMRESEAIAKQKAQDIINKAHFDALAILDGWRREIEKERKSMLAQMKVHIVDISLKVNKKMFWKQQVDRDFIEESMKGIE